MKQCRSCGRENENTAGFCLYCGNTFKEDVQTGRSRRGNSGREQREQETPAKGKQKETPPVIEEQQERIVPITEEQMPPAKKEQRTQESRTKQEEEQKENTVFVPVVPAVQTNMPLFAEAVVEKKEKKQKHRSHSARVDSNGRLTLPKPIREILGLKDGGTLLFHHPESEDDGRYSVTKRENADEGK